MLTFSISYSAPNPAVHWTAYTLRFSRYVGIA